VAKSVQLPSYSDNLKCGQDIFELGRNEIFDLLINHGRVEYSNPTRYERHHHTYIQGPQRDRMVYINSTRVVINVFVMLYLNVTSSIINSNVVV
jgi:hypothetical protein